MNYQAQWNTTGTGEDARAATLRLTPEQLDQLRALLAPAGPVAGEEPGRGTTPAQRARKLYQNRRKRESLFGPELFQDPSWDIMLDLFIAREEHRLIGISSACLASAAPPTTGLRHLNALVDRGIVTRSTSRADRRVSFVALSDDAHAKMMAMFATAD